MCKPLDDNLSASATTAAAVATDAAAATAATAGPQEESLPLAQQDRRKSGALLKKAKRVRFSTIDTIHAPLHQQQEEGEEEDTENLWYNRYDYQSIRHDINFVVRNRAIQDHFDDGGYYMYCYNIDDSSNNGDDDPSTYFRGLEFLKLHPSVPSRKERRMAFTKSVVIFQYMLLRKEKRCTATTASSSICNNNNNDNKHKNIEHALYAYCIKLSYESQKRAYEIALYDEIQARNVYYDCKFIYKDYKTLHGQEVCMFPSTTTTTRRSSGAVITDSNHSMIATQQRNMNSICRRQQQHQRHQHQQSPFKSEPPLTSSSYSSILLSPVKDVISYSSYWMNLLTNGVRNTTTGLFTTPAANTTATAAAH